MLALCLLSLVMGLAGLRDPDDTRQQAAFYCNMVYTYQHNPEQGWPDFKGTYGATCDSLGRLRKDWAK
jgi:hypothetical protein